MRRASKESLDKNPVETLKLPWREHQGHLVTRDGLAESVAFNVGAEVAAVIAKAVNAYFGVEEA